MYKDSRRWALTFQSYVQLTMLQNHSKKQVSNMSDSVQMFIHPLDACWALNTHIVTCIQTYKTL